MQIHVLHGAPPALGTQPGQERGTLSDCSTSFRNSSAPAKGWDGPGPCVTSLDALLGSSALHFQGLRPAWLWWHRCHISSSTHLLPTHQIQGRDPAHATADSRKVTPLSMYETHSTFLQHLFCWKKLSREIKCLDGDMAQRLEKSLQHKGPVWTRGLQGKGCLEDGLSWSKAVLSHLQWLDLDVLLQTRRVFNSRDCETERV